MATFGVAVNLAGDAAAVRKTYETPADPTLALASTVFDGSAYSSLSSSLGWSSVERENDASAAVAAALAAVLGETGCPRTLSAAEVLAEDSDSGSSAYCAPAQNLDDYRKALNKSLETLGLQGKTRRQHEKASDRPRDAGRTRRSTEKTTGGVTDVVDGARAPTSAKASGADEAPIYTALVSRKAHELILPRGPELCDNHKFVCVFRIGIDDDDEFCLVKRILGKAGNNMRRVADEFNAKVRLRGIGSGFLEGANGREANMPLQLNISCTTFKEYNGAIESVSGLLLDLYKHYRRYVRSKGREPPDVQLNLEEVRRDDHGIDLLAEKAQRSASQRDRDRKKRDAERQEREQLVREPAERGGSEHVEKASCHEDDDRSDTQKFTLPDGQPVPTTPAGRRAAARIGGAAAAAVASAAARASDRQERERLRREREARGGERRQSNWVKTGKTAGGGDGWAVDHNDTASAAAASRTKGSGKHAMTAVTPPPPPPLPEDRSDNGGGKGYYSQYKGQSGKGKQRWREM